MHHNLKLKASEKPKNLSEGDNTSPTRKKEEMLQALTKLFFLALEQGMG